jgi:hypothetical protein
VSLNISHLETVVLSFCETEISVTNFLINSKKESKREQFKKSIKSRLTVEQVSGHFWK